MAEKEAEARQARLPAPSMLPTCCSVPETSTPADVLLLTMFTRLEPVASAETEPANSSVAPDETGRCVEAFDLAAQLQVERFAAEREERELDAG